MKLFLGVIQGFFPWVYENQINQFMRKHRYGILFSYWQFRKSIQKIKSLGLHEFFSYDGPIMIDSGAFSAYQSGAIIPLKDYIDFLTQVEVNDDDFIVNLDIIGERKKSTSNWSKLEQKVTHPILPVVHFPSLNLSDYSGLNLGMGGMVSSLKINEKGSVHDVAAWISKFRSLTNKSLHGFGLGSPSHQVAFNDMLESIDWIGWRKNAAIGDCYTPEGSRSVPNVRYSQKTRKWLTLELFEKYRPPFISCYSSLQLPGTVGWKYRAVWNVWMFLTAHKHILTIEKSPYVTAIRKRIRNFTTKNQLRNLSYYFN